MLPGVLELIDELDALDDRDGDVREDWLSSAEDH